MASTRTTQSRGRIGTQRPTSCFCGNPDEHGFMVGCDACDSWCHGKCVNIESEDAANNLTFFRCGSCEAADGPVRRCKVCKVNVQLTQAGLVRVHKVNGSKCRSHVTSEYDIVSSVNEPQCIKLLRAFCSD